MQQKYVNSICTHVGLFYAACTYILALSGKNTTMNESITYAVPTLDPNMPSDSKPTCSLLNFYKVYKTVRKQDDQIAIENTTSSRVVVYVWSPQLPTAYTELYSSKKFKAKFINTRFQYIGNTTAGKQSCQFTLHASTSIHFIVTELVKRVEEWYKILDTAHSLKYCKTNCSVEVMKLLLQPCN